MSLLRQVVLTLLLLACATVAAARYYPASHGVLTKMGVPPNLIEAVAIRDSADSDNPEAGGPPGRGPRVTLVTTAPVSSATIQTRINAIGSSEALRSVSVVPLDAGVLKDVRVKSGDVVAAGDVLAELNDDSEEIARDRAAVTLKTAEATYARYVNLGQTNATSQVDLDSLLFDRDDAVLALREAQVALDQRSVLAPIDGVVGIVPVEVGDYITAETEVAMIDDRSQVVVDFWVPERFAGTITLGQPVRANSLALSSKAFEGQVSAIGSRIDTDSRTLQVRALIDNPDDLLRPGMSFSISMAFEGETHPSVDPLALQWDAEGSYVWALVDGMAKRTPARILQRNANAVLVEAELVEGALVITEGTLNVRDGAAVRVEGAGSAAGPDNVAEADEDPPDPSAEPSSGAEG